MKTTYFPLPKPSYGSSEPDEFGNRVSYAEFKIPILPAYAIASCSTQGMRSSVQPSIQNDIVRIYNETQLTQLLDPKFTLIINYLGIRNYELFFPQIENNSLRSRAGSFMEEAEKTFEESSWLSFTIMAGSVFESLLVDLTNELKLPFGALIKKITPHDIFNADEIETLSFVKEARNLVHAGRYSDSYITRDKAMSVRLALDEFLRKDWVDIKTRYANTGAVDGINAG